MGDFSQFRKIETYEEFRCRFYIRALGSPRRMKIGEILFDDRANPISVHILAAKFRRTFFIKSWQM